MPDNIKNQSICGLSKCEDFIIEFYGYNLTTSGVVKKLYVKAPFANKEDNDKNIILDNDNLNLILNALDNKYLSSFNSKRYSLFDISFRESASMGRIGFSFNDIKDLTYIEPKLVFKSFVDFGIAPLCEIMNKIQNSIFPKQPRYNPIFMLGLVIDNTNLVCIKSYIRFDLEEVPTSIERGYIVERIVKAINPGLSSAKYFFVLTQQLEKLGFVFSFTGVDYYGNGTTRFKLYFRFHGEKDLSAVAKKVALILSRFCLHNSVQDIFDKHRNGIWGLAVSTVTFEYVNGVQLYFYP